MKKHLTIRGLALLTALAWSAAAQAEVKEIHVAQQYGISYLPLMIMNEQKLIEKYAKAAGLGDITVTWARFKSGTEMNDAILSNNLHFASGGVGPLITMWAKTRGSYDVKAVSALNSMPLYLTTRNPDVKTLKDFTDKDRIALPAVKVSMQAVTLQIAAEKAFGPGKQNQLDRLTISMSHPDGQIAMLSGKSEITAHFTAPPFQYQELAKPGIHKITSSYEALGGPTTFILVWATSKFRNENPKAYGAFVKALDDAIAQINKDKKTAAETYIRVAKSKDTAANILKMLNDPEIVYTTTPQSVMKYAAFMHKVGSIKIMPKDWKEMFFSNVHHLNGG